jgi:hypothetical protein
VRPTHFLFLFLATGLFFAYFGGLTILDPSNYNWFKGEDPLQHLLGWLYFRETPIWQFPLGINPDFGEATSSSIVFSDSLPIFAIPLKFINSILPEKFQYFGIWIGLCFLLQAFFAMAILRRLGLAPWPSVLGAILILASPIMLYRLHGHEALIGHWMILAAVYLYLQPRYAMKRWLLLIVIATGVHAYLLAMVGSVWLADMIQRRPSWQRILAHTASVLATVGLTAWSIGYFVGPGGNSAGFGKYRTTLHSWFDTEIIWGRVLPNIPSLEGTYEGFAYLGLGVMLTLAVTFVAWIRHRKKGEATLPLAPEGRSLRPLFLIAVGSSIFALSDTVGAFGVIFFDLNVPEGTPLTNIFRASGRFIWLPTYLVILLAIAILARRLPERATAAVLALAAIVQVADISAAAEYFRDYFAAPRDSHIKAEFWDTAIPRYERLSFWPRRPEQLGIVEAGIAAAYHGASIDMARLARYDPIAAAAATAEVTRQITSADWRDDTLYLLQDDRAVNHLRIIGALESDDLIANVDGFTIVAPNWTGDIADLGVEPLSPELPASPAVSYPALLRFGTGGNAEPHLGLGWSWAEPPGRWTVGSMATVRLRLPDTIGPDPKLYLKATPFLGGVLQAQPLTITANGRALRQIDMTTERAQEAIEVDLPPDLLAADGELELRLDIGHPLSPQVAGLSVDSRPLGVMVDYVFIADRGAPLPSKEE